MLTLFAALFLSVPSHAQNIEAQRIFSLKHTNLQETFITAMKVRTAVSQNRVAGEAVAFRINAALEADYAEVLRNLLTYQVGFNVQAIGGVPNFDLQSIYRSLIDAAGVTRAGLLTERMRVYAQNQMSAVAPDLARLDHDDFQAFAADETDARGYPSRSVALFSPRNQEVLIFWVQQTN